MKFYIDKEKTLKIIKDNCNNENQYILNLIENLSPEDVVPIIHAKWDSAGYCTNCEEEAFYNWERGFHYLTKFCPFCGANMEE